MRREIFALLVVLAVPAVSAQVGAPSVDSIDAPTTVEPGEEFSIDVTASDPEGNMASIFLDFQDRPSSGDPDSRQCYIQGSSCSHTFNGLSIQSTTTVEVVASDESGNSATRDIQISTGGYSISDARVSPTTIPEGENQVRFQADVDAPQSGTYTVNWFLNSRRAMSLTGSGSGTVTSTISYSELRDKGFSPGSYDLGSRITAGGDQKDTDPGGTVEIEPRQKTDSGGDDGDNSKTQGEITLIVDLKDAEGDDMRGGDYTLEGDGQVRQKNGGRTDTRFTGVDASESYDLSVQCGPETVREDVNPSGGDTERVELTLNEASTIDSCVFYSGSDPDPSPDPDPGPGLGGVADITVLEPDSVEENPVQLKISLDRDPDKYSCFWDDDSFDLVDTGNRLSRSGDTFSDSSNFDSGQTVYFQCERTDGELTDRKQATFTLQQTVQQPTADLEITPRTGQEGDPFTFDASGSSRADRFEFDLDGDGDTDRTTFGDAVVTETINDPGQNIRAEVEVFNDAGSDTDAGFYTVERDQRVPEAELDVRPGVGDSGDAFTFDASNSERGQTFRYDFDGDGITDETTSSDTVTREINRTGSFQASVEVSNDAGSRQAFDGYVVGERPDPVAEITVLSPQEGERVNPPVQAEIQLSQDGSRYECFYDDDSVAVAESGRDADEDSGSLSGSGNRFEASVPSSDLQKGDARLFFQCERGDGERTGTKSVSFTVEEEGSAPTARFSVSNPSPDVNEQIQFDARSSSDPDNDIINYDFNFGDGFTSSGVQTTHSYTDPGVYTVRLVVEDSEGRTDTTTRTVNVQNLSPPPQGDSPPSAGFTFAPQIPRAGDTLRLRSTASDPDNDIDYRNWRIETPGGREFDFDSGIRASYQAEESGTYTVTHTVRDSNDNSDSATRDIIVSEPQDPGPSPPPPQDDSPPEADFTFTPQNPQTGTEVVFQSTATDPDNDIQFRNWRIETPEGREFDFSSGTTARYTPQNRGFYSVTHRVRDSGDRTDTTTQLVQVTGNGGNQQCGLDAGSVSQLNLDPNEVGEGEKSDVSVKIDNDGADQDVRVEFVSFDFSTGTSETIKTVEREVKEGEEERFESEVEVDSDSRVTAEVFTEGDECGDQFITSTSERLEFSGQQQEDGVVRISAFTNLGTEVNAFVTLTGPEDRAVNVGGDGKRSLTVEPGSYEATARFSGNVRSRSIDVESGEVQPVSFTFPSASETTGQTETATGLTARLDSKEVDAGQRVKVRGDIRGASGPQTVQLYSEGDRVSSTSSARDGTYTIGFTPNRVGELSLSVRAAGETAERRVRVLPTSSVLSVEAPQQVFEGDQFQVCGRIQTQEQAEVSLLRNGEELASKSGSGEVCFDATARDTGDNEYTVRSSTYGNGNQKSVTVKVLEDQAEASISTDQVATVETESGTVQVSIYNNNDEKQTYKADLTGIPDTWAETTTREVVLQPGEEEDIYFYTTPQEEGDFNPQVQVTEGGRTVLKENISLEVGGRKTQEQVSGGGLVKFILSGLNPV